MKKEDLIKRVVNAQSVLNDEQLQKNIETYLDELSLIKLCFNELGIRSRIDLINDYCEENNYNNYYENNKQNIIELLNNDAEKVFDFVKENNNYLYRSYLAFDGCDKLKTISDYDIISLYENENHFNCWLIDNNKIADYVEIIEDKDEIIEDIKKLYKNTFIKCTFTLYQKEHNHIMRRKSDEAEPATVDGFVRIVDGWSGEKLENYFIFVNDEARQIDASKIKHIEGYDALLNHRYNLPSLEQLNIENIKELKREISYYNNAQNYKLLINIGSYSYVENHCSGASYDGELKAYYLRLLKDYGQIVFCDNGKIYTQKSGNFNEYNPLNASTSDNTKKHIKNVIDYLWREVKKYNGVE